MDGWIDGWVERWAVAALLLGSISQKPQGALDGPAAAALGGGDDDDDDDDDDDHDDDHDDEHVRALAFAVIVCGLPPCSVYRIALRVPPGCFCLSLLSPKPHCVLP